MTKTNETKLNIGRETVLEQVAKTTVAQRRQWKSWEKIAFRIAFIFFICICIPNSPEWYKQALSLDWSRLHYRDLYDIARFGSGINLFGNTIFGTSLNGYANWIITLGVSAVLGLAWTLILNWRKVQVDNYDTLYYWLRAIVRYRAAIGIIGFGFTKLLPTQMPYPSTALLNTDFGDFTAQKIYWLSIGIVPWYQVFAGVVEIGAGVLLLFRKTTLLGAILLFGALGDIVYVNFAYDGGVHVYSSYFVLLSAFLIAHYVPQLYRLFILEKTAWQKEYYPALTPAWQYTRYGAKAATFIIFLGLLFYLQYVNFLYDPYKQPSTKGVSQLRGYYDVTEFRLNGEVIPYSPTDTVRWQEATFENWTTLTFKVNKATPLDLSNGGGDPQRDINRTFEITGTAGGRRAFHYFADTIQRVLYLQDKFKSLPDRRNVVAGVGGDGGRNNTDVERRPEVPERNGGIYADNWISDVAWKNIGDEVRMIDPRAATARREREFAEAGKKFDKRNRMVLSYSVDENRVILKGVNEDQDSVHIVLTKFDREYALSRSTLEAGKY
jgi:hypothetical protein